MLNLYSLKFAWMLKLSSNPACLSLISRLLIHVSALYIFAIWIYCYLQKFLNFPLTHSSAARYTVNLDRYLIVAFNSLISAWTIIMMWATFANVQNCQGKGEGGPRVIVH